MKKVFLPLVALSLFAAICPTIAEEIGRATVNGRAIIIDQNGTWRYAEAEAQTQNAPSSSGCPSGYEFKSKRLPLTACFSKDWKIDSTPTGSMEFTSTNTSLDLYTGVVVERLELSRETLRKAIIENAATGSGVRAEDIQVIVENTQSFGDKDWQYIELDLVYSGTTFRFGNYSLTLPKGGAIQMVFWSSPAFYEQNKAAVLEVMKSAKISN